ncbi:MAG: glycosyltransferase [Isosphaeraceae bacterium]
MSPRKIDRPHVAIVLASIGGARSLGPCLSAFARELAGRGEIVVVDASPDGPPDLGSRTARTPWRLLHRDPDWLAPELWADGIDATDAPLVVLSTTQTSPQSGWLDTLLDRLARTDAAAVGGPIDAAEGLSPFDRALYLQRYANYRSPLPVDRPIDPPGDNVIYRRDRLTGLEPLWAAGFWEIEIHRRLRERGESLVMAPEAILRFQGGSPRIRTLIQRFSHARKYGSDRTRDLNRAGRLVSAARAPLVPPLLASRCLRALRAREESIVPWSTSFPALALILGAWASGEAWGTLLGDRGRSRIGGDGPLMTGGTARRRLPSIESKSQEIQV